MWELRDKGLNLDLHVQSVASCRLDDPGTNGACRRHARSCSVFSSRPAASREARRWRGQDGVRRAPPSIPSEREIDAASERCSVSRCASSFSFSPSLTMFSVPLAYPSTLDRWPLVAQDLQWSASYVEELWSPILRFWPGKRQAKALAYFQRVFPAHSRGSFSLRRGLDSI
jgi:hypothetical protein